MILDGRKLANKIQKKLKKEIEVKQLKLKLAVILVGKNSASESYIRKKKETCLRIGVGFKLFDFPDSIRAEDLGKEIKEIIGNKKISGIVIQLPFPKNLNASEFLNLIPLEKDIDVLSDLSFEKFSKGELQILPPVVGAVKYLLEEYKIPLKDQKIVLIGKGRLVGKPLSVWLAAKKANFSVVDRKVENLSSFIRKADIIISGAGSPGLIKGEMVKEGAVVIDAGISTEEGKTVGDADFKSVSKKARFITPVPGGVGPMTVACLLQNLVWMYTYSKK